jgi:hypothetical protein
MSHCTRRKQVALPEPLLIQGLIQCEKTAPRVEVTAVQRLSCSFETSALSFVKRFRAAVHPRPETAYLKLYATD